MTFLTPKSHPYAAKGEGIQTRRLYLKGYPSGTGFEYGCVVSKGEEKIYVGQNSSVMNYMIIGVGIIR